jgi:predicted MFS family arabinose efflux permease
MDRRSAPSASNGGLRRFWKLPRFRRNLWLLLLSCLLGFTALGVQSLILNLYLVTIGYREDFLGLFALVNTAGVGSAALVAGRISNRLGPRRTLVFALGALALSSAALLATSSSLPLLVIAAVNGAAQAHVFVPCATFVMDNAEPTDRSPAYSGYFAAQSLAFVIGSYLGGVLPGLFAPAADLLEAGYVATLLVAAGSAAIGVVPLLLADDSKAPGSHASKLPTTTRDQNRRMRRDMTWIIASNALVAAAMGFVIPFLNVFFSQQLGADTLLIGLIFAIGSGAMVVASLVGPVLGRRFGVVPTIALGRGLTAPIFIGMALSPTVPIAASFYVLRTFFTNMTWPVDNAFTMELVRPDLRATLAGYRSASWNLAWAVTSGIAGVMIVTLGFPSIFVVASVFMALGSAAFYVAFSGYGAASPGDVSADQTVASSAG